MCYQKGLNLKLYTKINLFALVTVYTAAASM